MGGNDNACLHETATTNLSEYICTYSNYMESHCSRRFIVMRSLCQSWYPEAKLCYVILNVLMGGEVYCNNLWKPVRGLSCYQNIVLSSALFTKSVIPYSYPWVMCAWILHDSTCNNSSATQYTLFMFSRTVRSYILVNSNNIYVRQCWMSSVSDASGFSVTSPARLCTPYSAEYSHVLIICTKKFYRIYYYYSL